MTEQEAGDVLDEIEAAIAAGRSMGQGSWAILNVVRRLSARPSMSDVMREIADATPAQIERLANAVLRPES